MRTVAAALLFLALLAGSGAAESTPEMTALATMDQRVETAMVRADRKFLEQVLAEDFRFNHIGAHRFQTKEQLIEEFGKPGAFVSRDVDEVSVEPHGDTALTRGRIHFKTPDGNEQTLWYVRLYAQRGGRWQLVSHVTMSKAKGPLPK